MSQINVKNELGMSVTIDYNTLDEDTKKIINKQCILVYEKELRKKKKYENRGDITMSGIFFFIFISCSLIFFASVTVACFMKIFFKFTKYIKLDDENIYN